MDYCIALLRKENRELALQVYLTDALKHISENTAKMVGGSYMAHRFADVLFPQEKPQQTSEQVIDKIRKKLGGGR